MAWITVIFKGRMMDWLKALAPTLAAAVAGPFAPMAYELVSKVIGGTADDAKKLIEAGKLSSDQITQIKLAEDQVKARESELGLDFAKLAAGDRANARNMQIANKSYLVPTLAVIIVGSFIATIGATLLGYSHIESAMMGTLVGYLSAKAEQVVSFYFGSSNSSQNKDQLLYNSTPTK